jgi:nucleoside-diphosphate-sugar epimerase
MMDDYDKIPIEEAVSQLTSDWTILRLPMIYGPEDPLRRFDWALRSMVKNNPVIEVPSRWMTWATAYTYAANAAEAVMVAAGHPAASRRIFNVGDEAPLAHSVWIDRLRWATGWRGEVKVNDDPDSNFSQAIAGLDLSVPLNVSPWRIHHELGYKPVISLEEALVRLAATARADLAEAA